MSHCQNLQQVHSGWAKGRMAEDLTVHSGHRPLPGGFSEEETHSKVAPGATVHDGKATGEAGVISLQLKEFL